MSIQATVAAWERYIVEVREKFAAVLRDTDAKSNATPVRTADDIQVVGRLWSVAKAQQHKHSELIQSRWNDVLDELAAQRDGTDPEDGFMPAQGAKRDQGTLELEVAYEHAFRAAMARAAEQLLAAGPERPENVSAVAHLIADAASITDWEEMTRAERAMKSYRNRKDVPLATLETLADATNRYHTKRLTVEARYLPLLQPHIATKVGGQMEAVLRTLKQYWQWREAHPK